jgi:hypothetical protein
MATFTYDATPLIKQLRELGKEGIFREVVMIEVEKTVQALGNLALKKLNDIVEPWDHDVQFSLTFYSDPNLGVFSFEIEPNSQNELDDLLFTWVDEGTERHYIPDGLLMMKGHPLTWKLPDGMYISARRVDNPGIEPREFTQEIINETEGLVNAWIGDAVVRAVDQVKDETSLQ